MELKKHNPQKSRRGSHTIITSFSIPKELRDKMRERGVSPTECLRKGLAVTFAEAGDIHYQTPLNKERCEMLDRMEKVEKAKLVADFFYSLEQMNKIIERILKC